MSQDNEVSLISEMVTFIHLLLRTFSYEILSNIEKISAVPETGTYIGCEETSPSKLKAL